MESSTKFPHRQRFENLVEKKLTVNFRDVGIDRYTYTQCAEGFFDIRKKKNKGNFQGF